MAAVLWVHGCLVHVYGTSESIYSLASLSHIPHTAQDSHERIHRRPRRIALLESHWPRSTRPRCSPGSTLSHSCTTGLSYPTLSHSSPSLSSHTSSRLRIPIPPSAVVTRATFSTAPHPPHALPPRPSSGPTTHTRADRAPPLSGCDIPYRMVQCTWQTWTIWTTRTHLLSRP